MICYHGSDVIVKNPVILNSRRPLDFGDGFYVTSSKTQAINWAKKVSYRNNSPYKYVNIYETYAEGKHMKLSPDNIKKKFKKIFSGSEKPMKLSANMEDYLEAVSLCANEKGLARISDIRNMMNVKTPA